MRFSVIVPCFNVEAHLDAAIQSCLRQTVPDLEVIVVDDGSTDGSAAVAMRAARHDARVRLLQQPNRGLGAARNAGLAAATGTFVNFLDADDQLEPEKLALQGAMLEANPQLGLVLCDGCTVDQDDHVVWETLVDRRRFDNHPPLFEILFRGGAFPPLVPLLRRELATSVGGFDEDRVVAGWADTGFWMRIALSGADYYFMPRPLVRYRTTPTSMSADREAMARAAVAIYASVMARWPRESAQALRAAHDRLRDLDRAADDLRLVVDSLMAARDAATAAGDQLAAANRHLEWELGRTEEARRRGQRGLFQALVHLTGESARPMMIWGAGAGGRAFLALIQRAGGTAQAFIDSNPAKAGTILDGLPIVTPDTLTADPRRPFVIIASVHAAAIEEQLRSRGWLPDADYHIADFNSADLTPSA
jgi:GT2 family glycosyltransferase